MACHPLHQQAALPCEMVTQNEVSATKPWFKVPSLGTGAQPASCPISSLSMHAPFPKEGWDCHKGHTKTMFLFPNTFLGIQPWDEEGWARKLYDLILSQISLTRRKQGLTACSLLSLTMCALLLSSSSSSLILFWTLSRTQAALFSMLRLPGVGCNPSLP